MTCRFRGPLTDVRYLQAAAEHVADLKSRSLDALGLFPGAAVLDVGCGPGGDVQALSATKACRVVGVDVDLPMLGAARTHAARNAAFICADTTRLPFSDSTFDAVRSERMLQHLPDPAAAVAEMARVTRPGGRLVLIDTDWASLTIQGTGAPATEQLLIDILLQQIAASITAGSDLSIYAARDDLQILDISRTTFTTGDAEFVRLITHLDMAENIALATGLLDEPGLTTWRGRLTTASSHGTLRGSLTLVMMLAVRRGGPHAAGLGMTCAGCRLGFQDVQSWEQLRYLDLSLRGGRRRYLRSDISDHHRPAGLRVEAAPRRRPRRAPAVAVPRRVQVEAQYVRDPAGAPRGTGWRSRTPRGTPPIPTPSWRATGNRSRPRWTSTRPSSRWCTSPRGPGLLVYDLYSRPTRTRSRTRGCWSWSGGWWAGCATTCRIGSRRPGPLDPPPAPDDRYDEPEEPYDPYELPLADGEDTEEPEGTRTEPETPPPVSEDLEVVTLQGILFFFFLLLFIVVLVVFGAWQAAVVLLGLLLRRTLGAS